jgi:hypothetical protein
MNTGVCLFFLSWTFEIVLDMPSGSVSFSFLESKKDYHPACFFIYKSIKTGKTAFVFGFFHHFYSFFFVL